MAKATVERRISKGLCVVCGKPNDNLPLQMCLSCTKANSEKGRAYYRHNRAKTLKRTRAYYLEHQGEYAKWRDDWYAKHPYFSRQANLRVKIQAMQIVSGKAEPACVYCGCDDIRFLEINHKKGGGAKESLTSGSNFYWAIVKGRRKTDDLEIACGLDNKLHYYKLKYGEGAALFIVSWLPKGFVRFHTT